MRRATPEDMQIGLRISAARQTRRMSLTRFAMIMGVTVQQVLRWEKGQRACSAATLHKIATALEVPLLQLYGWPTAARGVPVPVASKDAIEISKLIDNLPPVHRPAARRAIRALLRSFDHA